MKNSHTQLVKTPSHWHWHWLEDRNSDLMINYIIYANEAVLDPGPRKF